MTRLQFMKTIQARLLGKERKKGRGAVINDISDPGSALCLFFPPDPAPDAGFRGPSDEIDDPDSFRTDAALRMSPEL